MYKELCGGGEEIGNLFSCIYAFSLALESGNDITEYFIRRITKTQYSFY